MCHCSSTILSSISLKSESWTVYSKSTTIVGTLRALLLLCTVDVRRPSVWFCRGVAAFASEPDSTQRAHSACDCYVKRPCSFAGARCAFLCTVHERIEPCC